MSVRVSEAAFQQAVIEAASLNGWRHVHTRKAIVRRGRVATPTSIPGWPDLVLWNPSRGGVMFVELKRVGEKPSEAQREVLASLAAAGAVTDVWTPDQWDRITAMLQGRPV